jgi:hypothetical protein
VNQLAELIYGSEYVGTSGLFGLDEGRVDEKSLPCISDGNGLSAGSGVTVDDFVVQSLNNTVNTLDAPQSQVYKLST